MIVHSEWVEQLSCISPILRWGEYRAMIKLAKIMTIRNDDNRIISTLMVMIRESNDTLNSILTLKCTPYIFYGELKYLPNEKWMSFE